MIVVLFVGGLILGLVALYVITPHYQRFSTSSARFFVERDDGPIDRPLIRWQSLLFSRSFWAQLFVLVGLLLAGLFPDLDLGADHGRKQVGVWIVLDTSASMSTSEGRWNRMDLARRQIEKLVAQLDEFDKDRPACVNVSTFDLEVIDLPVDTLQEIKTVVDGVEHRPLGTDLGLVRNLIARSQKQSDAVCPITHMLVVTDTPFPAWIGKEAAAQENMQIIWLDVASQVDNVGIVDALSQGTVLGASNDVNVELAALGTIPPETTLTVTDADGQVVHQQTFTWGRVDSHRLSLSLPGAGGYTIAIADDDAYTYDNRLKIVSDDRERIRVDWQLPDPSLVTQLGWVPDHSNPHIRISAYTDQLPSDDVPTLLVGDGYFLAASREAESEITYFAESPLLEDINLNVAEKLDIRGVTLPEDSPLRPVLYDSRGSTWLAVDEQMPAVYVPGPPFFGEDENLRAFSTTLFFNALRWLRRAWTPPPLYTLTTPRHPTEKGNRNALHPNEGNTQPPQSYGDIESIQPLYADEDGLPSWLVLLCCATCILLIERGLAMFGGGGWQ